MNIYIYIYLFIYLFHMLECDLAVRHGKMGGSNWVNWVAGQTGHESKIGNFKLVKKGFMSIRLRVGSG